MSFTNIFGNTKNDESLNQGSNFNGIQQKIKNGVLHELPLMEQTSSPELDSFVESLENINKSNPLTSESSLQKLD